MIYIRKIFTQDLREGKQIAFPKEPSNEFFLFDFTSDSAKNISFKYNSINNPILNGQEIKTRLYPAGSEARIDGELKAFLRDKLNAKVDDIVFFRKQIGDSYEFQFIPQGSEFYSAYINILNNKNHIVGLDQSINQTYSDITTIQKIYFGAPGTGKSYEIKTITENTNNKITTIFHPDTDYASFVGCYKPLMGDDNVNITYKFVPQAFANTYVNAWKLLLNYKTDNSSFDIEETYKKWLPNNGVRSITQYLNGIKGIKELEKDPDNVNIFEITDPLLINNIIVEQYSSEGISKRDKDKRSHLLKYKTFLEALVRDTNIEVLDKNYYLIIEEINRGNCAQIFGDLFQLLDRNKEGFSEYVIDVDKDFTDFLIRELAGLKGYKEKICKLAGISKGSFSFSKIALPNNLSILATMNTSDQSLFPMDSAFKRRWDWEYVPIDLKDVRDIEIKINGGIYSWSKFITIVNDKIFKVNDSEDKQLGPYFVKATEVTNDDSTINRFISEEQFVSKVMFYLWFEVFKDEVSNTIFFTKKSTEGSSELENKRFSFNKLFLGKAKIDSERLDRFMKDALGMEPEPSTLDKKTKEVQPIEIIEE